MSKLPKLIVLDFDRTLLRAAFYDRCVTILREAGLLSELKYQATLLVLQDPTFTMNFISWLRELGVDLDRALTILRHELRSTGNLYEDVAPFLERANDHQILIATTGDFGWQHIKLSLVQKTLGAYTQTVLQGNKGAYLHEYVKATKRGVQLRELGDQHFSELILVDDRVDNLTPLIADDWATRYHIIRPDAKYDTGKARTGIKRITSLMEVKL